MDDSQTARTESTAPANVRAVVTSPPKRSLSPPQDISNSPFGADLEPVVRQHCQGRLAKINWFRTDWQRGGALTGYSTYRDDDNVEQPVVVKLPVPPREQRWIVQLQGNEVVPRLYAHGQELGGYDMCWVIMERLPHGPVGLAWGEQSIDLLIDAMVRFSKAAIDVPCTGEVRVRDYEAVREEARANIHRHTVAHEQRWNRALKYAHKQMRHWLALWEERDVNHWCHGDIHLGNAMTRCAPPHGPVVLIDLAQVHQGHWIEDAVYLEHLYWSRRDKLDGRKICKLVARQRKQHGLKVESNWPQIAAIRRAMIAMCTPAALEHMGNPHHVEAALEVLEAQVGR